jgi:glycosyltransferase involved in cell wall biosynthesis
MAPRASVIVTTYEQPNALRLALAALAAQTVRDFEVIVADDGSSPAVREVALAAGAAHVWHERRGFRKPTIQNAAVRASRGEVLIFLDGDCIPRRDHVQRHLEVADPRTFAAGGYARLTEPQARALTPEAVAAGAHERMLPAGSRLRLLFRHAQSHVYRLVRHPHRPKCYGCNLSVGRAIFEEVNGFDENYNGAGQEESDLRNRLVLAGARAVSLWSRCWVFHLPPVLDPPRAPEDVARVRKATYYRRRLTSPRCERGLFQQGEYGGTRPPSGESASEARSQA